MSTPFLWQQCILADLQVPRTARLGEVNTRDPTSYRQTAKIACQTRYEHVPGFLSKALAPLDCSAQWAAQAIA